MNTLILTGAQIWVLVAFGAALMAVSLVIGWNLHRDTTRAAHDRGYDEGRCDADRAEPCPACEPLYPSEVSAILAGKLLPRAGRLAADPPTMPDLTWSEISAQGDRITREVDSWGWPR